MKVRILLVSMLVLIIASVAFAGRSSVQLMSKEDLKARLSDPDTIVLDVRKGTDWRASEFMIKGAVRLELKQIAKVSYPKDKTLVLYCA